jgi:hypothetical protein
MPRAHTHRALGLGRIGNEDQARRLSQVENLLDSGLPPRELATQFGFELPSSDLSPDLNTFDLNKYDPDQPRNPAGSGVESGRWTKSPTGGSTVASALVLAAPSLAEGISAEAVTWLTRAAGRLALPAALFGAAFVPSPNTGVAEDGSIPDRPGLRYRLDRDTGTLRLSDANDADPTHALVAQLGADGVYRDVATRLAVARAIGDSVVLIDLDRAPAGSDDTDEQDDRPKLCPAPKDDQLGGRKLFDQMYEQYVRDTVNPQRRPQLPPGLTFALPGNTPSGWVHYDDCREADGAMIEAKGNYAEMLATQWGQEKLAGEWVDQASKQVQAAGNRRVEWYFHDPNAAAFAQKWFEANKLGSIRIHVLPYPGGVPKPNPRIR